jgi:UDP:flavonoid glycosyltransferase YjiC (YdhE family)
MTKRILFISGSLGLGHVTRDIAIAREIRSLRSDVDISWLAAHPASLFRETAAKVALRKKDKQFGRMINVAMKQMHKRKLSA